MTKRRFSTIYALFLGISLSASANSGFEGISEKLPTGVSSVSEQGLVAAYDFETFTSEGLLKDFSASKNHARFESKNAVEGLYGGALSLLTKDDVGILPDNGSLDLKGPITMVAKVKITKPGLHQHLFACNDLFVLWLTASNKYRFADTVGNGVTSHTAIPAVESGEWHTVAAVLSTAKGKNLTPENIKLYVNGVELESKREVAWGATEMVAKNACVIGGTRSGSQPHQDMQFEGILDELVIFSRALSESEIQRYSHN